MIGDEVTEVLLATGIMDRTWTVRRGDWLRVERDRVVDINPGNGGNAKFWAVKFLAYGTAPYVYSDSFHGSHAELLDSYVRSYGDRYRPRFWVQCRPTITNPTL
jgi:hypothetical protein